MSEARQGDANNGGVANMPDSDMFGNGLAGGWKICSGSLRARFGVMDRERQAGVVRAVEDMGELAADGGCFRGVASFTQAVYGTLIL